MRAVALALYEQMARDPEIALFVGNFEGGPAIFSARPVPAKSATPTVLCADTISNEPWDTINQNGRRVEHQIAIYGAADHQTDAVEMLAELIRETFHRKALAVTGFRVVNVVARGPIAVPADEGEIGRVITLTLLLDSLNSNRP